MDTRNQNFSIEIFRLFKEYADIWKKSKLKQKLTFEELANIHYRFEMLFNVSNFDNKFLESFKILSIEQTNFIDGIKKREITQLNQLIYEAKKDDRINYLEVFEEKIQEIDLSLSSLYQELRCASKNYDELKKIYDNPYFDDKNLDREIFLIEMDNAEDVYLNLKNKYNSYYSFKKEFIESNLKYFDSYLHRIFEFYEDRLSPLISPVGIEADLNQKFEQLYFSKKLTNKIYCFLKLNEFINCDESEFSKILNLQSSNKLNVNPIYLFYYVIDSIKRLLNDEVSEAWFGKILQVQNIEIGNYNAHYKRAISKDASKRIKELQTPLKDLFKCE